LHGDPPVGHQPPHLGGQPVAGGVVPHIGGVDRRGGAHPALPGRGATERTLGWLSSFDAKALVVELLVLIAFIVSLGSVNRVWVSIWGLLLLVGVVWFGILAPLRMHAKRQPLASAAKLVLVGGF